MTSILRQLEIAEREVAVLRTMTREGLASLPDNPHIRRSHVDGVSAFSIEASAICGLSAISHDWKHLYKMMSQWLDNVSVEHMAEAIRSAMQKKYFIHRRVRYHLCDEVIAHIESLL